MHMAECTWWNAHGGTHIVRYALLPMSTIACTLPVTLILRSRDPEMEQCRGLSSMNCIAAIWVQLTET